MYVFLPQPVVCWDYSYIATIPHLAFCEYVGTCMVYVYACFPVQVSMYRCVHMYDVCLCMFSCAGVQVQ